VSDQRYYFTNGKNSVDLDFPHLGFDYYPCPYRFEAVWELGVWRVRGLIENTRIEIPEGSQCLHYGQELFEGLKVHSGSDGHVYAFRPKENARRINTGARYFMGPIIPEELFIRAVEEVTRANYPYIPPAGSGAALYLRPFYIGLGDNVGVKPASRYLFRIFVTPVGPYFKGGFGPDQGKSFRVSRYDRAAPHGTGHIKAGGNYACSFLPGAEAKAAGYAEAIYLDPAEHRYIEEIGAANFLAFRAGSLLTPDSETILPSITRESLLHLAREKFGWKTERVKIALEDLDTLDSAAACGTAAVITWIRQISDGDRLWNFDFDPRWQELYDALTDIQTARAEDPWGWRHLIL